jgi:hypothetical protein
MGSRRTWEKFVLVLAAASMPLWAGAQGNATVEQLRAELERRDAIIADLLQRVQALEQRAGGAPSATTRAPAPPAAAARSVSEEAAEEALLERALERSLVLSGGAVLPRGQKEIEPSLAYDYTSRSGLAVVGTGVAFRNFRRENYTGALGFRLGLPYSAQLDIGLPFTRQEVESVVGGTTLRSTDNGRGDAQIALTKELMSSRDSRLALLGTIGYVWGSSDAALAPIARGVPDFLSPAAVASGHDAWVARIAATKRLDPMVFVAAYSHTWSRPETVSGIDVRTGDSNALSLRTILAASPDVSLRGGISFARTGKTRLGGTTLAGTASTASILELGTSVVLGRNMLLDISLGVGLTGDSPDFALGVSLPIRF